MSRKSKLYAERSRSIALWLSALLIVGVFLFLNIPQAKAAIPKEPFKIWHDRIFLGQLEMEKDVYMEAGLYLQGFLVNRTSGGDPVVVGDHLRVDGILFANNIIVRGTSGGDPVIIGDHLRVDGDIFNPFNAVRIKDDLRIKGALSGWSALKISSPVDVQRYLYSSKNSLEIKDGLVQSGGGQVTFSGNVDANSGLDVSGGDLTVGGSTKFRVRYGTGNISTDGTLTVAGTSSLATLSTSGLSTLDSLSVTRTSTFGNAINIQGNATFYKNVTLGDTAGDTIAIAGTASFSNPISGNVSTTGNLGVGGNLNVTGTSVCGTISFTNLTVSGGTTLQGAVQLGDAAADGITVTGTATFAQPIDVTNIAGTSTFTNDVAIGGDLDVTGTLTAGTISVAGTTNSAFTINSDNATADTEDSQLEFERGTVTPNAILRWDSTNDRFDLNQATLLQSALTVNGNTTLGDANTDTIVLNAYINDDLYLGANAETLANAGFTLDGNDLFVAGMAGIEGNVYTDGSFITGASTTYGDGTIISSGTLSLGTVGNLTLGDGGDPVVVSSSNWDVDASGNFTGVGTIGSGAITSSGAVRGTSLTDGTATLTGGNLSNVGTLTATTVNAITLQQGGVAISALFVDVAGDTMTGGLNMSNQVISNIGAAGTDFTGTGGLTLANALTVSAGGIQVTAGGIAVTAGGLNLNSTGITNAGAITGATGNISMWTNDQGYGRLSQAEIIAGNWDNTANPWADNEVANNLTISGGTVDNTVIGGTTAAAGTFTNLTATGDVDFSGATSMRIPNGDDLPDTCNPGELFMESDSDTCKDDGAGDGSLCICSPAGTWALIADF